ELSVSELLWRANKDVVRTKDEPLVIDDIAYDNENERNADPCTSNGCMWGKSSDGKVYVPFVIAAHYSSRERSIIERGLLSFHDVTCIRFVQRTSERDYLSIQSDSGCYSYVGRRGYSQTVSLDRQGCLYHNTVQHELLHALGFNHEQCRSDRDQYIRVLWENIEPGWAYAFDKINTLNQDTPYDYSSVMQYHSKTNSASVLFIFLQVRLLRQQQAYDGAHPQREYRIRHVHPDEPERHPQSEPAVQMLNSRTDMFGDENNMSFLGLLVLVTVSVWAEQEVAQALTTSERLERANRDVVRSPDEPYVEDDIAYDFGTGRNADPCTSRGCMWPKSADGSVYVAYTISSAFSSREVSIIERGLQSFHSVSCIRFVKRTNQRDYLNIQSLNGCYSYIGRLGNGQNLSLQRSGCVYHDTVQHEVLHALGFHHEQKRSDRDQYIRVVLENVTPGMEHNFDKVNTLNQDTTYDYGSVMHYHNLQLFQSSFCRHSLTFCSLWFQVRFLQEQPAHPGGHPRLQRSVRHGHRDEPEGHPQAQQAVQMLSTRRFSQDMAGLRCTLSLLAFMVVSIKAGEKKDKSVSEKIEEANKNIVLCLLAVFFGWEYAFDKINTLNQGTLYDYNSVMQYSKFAFSKNNQPTMVPIPDPNVEFGTATEMSQNDITRLNRLYNCR
ncbi:hypothetical protein L3Q82_023632, partial [Scortum barcoo]